MDVTRRRPAVAFAEYVCVSKDGHTQAYWAHCVPTALVLALAALQEDDRKPRRRATGGRMG